MNLLSIEFLLTSLLFVFPFGNLVRIPIYHEVTILPSDIILGLLLIVSLKKYLRTKAILLLPEFKALLFLVTILLMSLLANLSYLSGISLMVSILYLVRFLFYTQLLFVFRWVKKDFREKFLIRMLLVGGVTMILGLLQYFFVPDLRPYIVYGWDKHYLRLFGTFLDPNFFGIFLVIYFFSLLGWMQKTRRSQRLLLVTLMMTLVAVFLTYSRSSYLALLGGGLVYFLVSKQRRFLGIFLAIALVIFILIPKNRASEGVNLLRTASIQGRTDEFNRAVIMIKRNPLLGVGFNSLRYARQRYGFTETINSENHAAAGIPNSFLFITVAAGLIGLGAYLNVWRLIIQRIHLQTNRLTRSFLLASLTALFVSALFENSLFYPLIMLWIFPLLAIW